MSDVVDVLLQAVSVMGLAVFGISVVLQVVTYARARPVRPVAIVVGQAGTLLGMIVFSALTKRPPDAVLWVLLLAGGCAVGIVVGQLLRVQTSPSGIVMRYALPGLLAWAVLLLFVQGSVTFAGTVPLVAYGAAIAILGVNIGMTVRVIARARGQRTSPGALPRAVGILLLVGVLLLPVPGYATPGEHPVRYGGGYHTEWKSLADAPAETRPYIVNGGGAVRETTWPCSGVFDIFLDHRSIADMNYAFEAGRQLNPDTYEYWARVQISVYPTPEEARAAFKARFDGLTLHPQANLYWLTRDHRAVLGADDSWVELHEYEYGWDSSGPPYAIVDQYWVLAGSMIIDIQGEGNSGSLEPEIMKQHALGFEKWLADCAKQIVDAARKRDLGPYLVATYLGGTGETGTGGGTGGKTGTGGGTGEATRPGPDGKYPPLTPLQRGTATGAAGGLMLLGALLQLLLTLRTAPVGAPSAAMPPAPAVPAAGPAVPGLPAVVPPARAKRGLFTLVGVLAAVVVLGVAVFILVPFVSSLMGGGGGPGDGVTDIRGTWVSTTPGKGLVFDVVGVSDAVESGRPLRLESDVEWVIDGVDGGRATGKWRRVNIRNLLGGQSTTPTPDEAFQNIVLDIGKDGSLSNESSKSSPLRMRGTVEGDRFRMTLELKTPSGSILSMKGTMDLTRKK
jgi:hypothetical protein